MVVSLVSLGRTYGVFLPEKGSFNSGFDFELGLATITS